MENAFALLAQYHKAARRAGVSKDRIEEVLQDAKSKDYSHLVDVIGNGMAEIGLLI